MSFGPNIPPQPGEPIRSPGPDEVPVQDPDIVPNPEPTIDPAIDEPQPSPEGPMIEPPM